MPTSFVCISSHSLSYRIFSESLTMKPRVGVYLSEQMAARLAAAAKRPGATKSGLVEAALERFLGSDDDIGDAVTVAGRLNGLSRQLEQLDRGLRIVNETVALHARFHLAVTPPMPAVAQRASCALGAERFNEFAAQVGRRVDLGLPLMRETIDRLGTTRSVLSARDLGQGETSRTPSTDYEPSQRASTAFDDVSQRSAAAREDGSIGGFPGRTGRPLH
jgi:hypothetical protein